MCDTTTAVALSLSLSNVQERAARGRVVLGGHFSWFSLSLCVSLSRRVSYLPALCFDSAGASSLHFVSTGSLALLSSLPAFCSRSAGGALLSSPLSTLLPESLVHISIGQLRINLTFYF